MSFSQGSTQVGLTQFADTVIFDFTASLYEEILEQVYKLF